MPAEPTGKICTKVKYWSFPAAHQSFLVVNQPFLVVNAIRKSSIINTIACNTNALPASSAVFLPPAFGALKTEAVYLQEVPQQS
jgi:hypothetical protein